MQGDCLVSQSGGELVHNNENKSKNKTSNNNNNNNNNSNNDNNDIDIPRGGLECLVFCEGRKAQELREKPSEQGQEPTINSIHM